MNLIPNLTPDIKSLRAGALGILLIGVACTTANATLSLGLSHAFKGAPPDSPTTPWVSTILSEATPNEVWMTVTAPNLTASEHIRSLYWNFNDEKDVTQLDFSVLRINGFFGITSLGQEQNSFRANGGGFYDLRMSFFDSGGAARRFTQGDELVLRITAPFAFSADDFDFTSSLGCGPGGYYAAALIGATGLCNQDNTWIGADTATTATPAIPEANWPVGAALLCGLVLLSQQWRNSR